MKTLQCEMNDACVFPVTHIDEKGFIYCKLCARERRYSGRRARAMRPWELKLVRNGGQVPSYRPMRKRDYQRAKLESVPSNT